LAITSQVGTGGVNRHLGIGWEFVHVCIDDASRIAFSQVMKDERKESAVALPQGGRGSIGSKPPVSRLDLTYDNLLRLHT
jgi:hypothetical protein